jgi:hypothetical protein
MATVMHISIESRWSGKAKTLCGKTLRAGEGAAFDAPLCPTCVRNAGWTRDKRR